MQLRYLKIPKYRFTNPDEKYINLKLQAKKASAEAMFVFSSREEGAVSSVVDGKLGHDQLQQALTAARLASKAIFEFYRETIRRKFSKEV